MSETALTTIVAVVIAQFAMSLTGIALTRHQSREIGQIRTAIDSMAQGLCMFDASEWLVVCNSQYYRMYELAPEGVEPGSTLSEVLARRVAKGTFSRDPGQYRKEFLAAVAQGRTIVHEVKSKGGAPLAGDDHPMKGGGWIGTHENITERRQAEEQRTAMQQQEERRALVDNAISAFRARAEQLMQTVSVSAGEMRLTAGGFSMPLVICRDVPKAPYRRRMKRRRMLKALRPPPDELSNSISEIAQRLNQSSDSTVGEAQATNQDIDVFGAGCAEDWRRHQADPQHR